MNECKNGRMCMYECVNVCMSSYLPMNDHCLSYHPLYASKCIYIVNGNYPFILVFLPSTPPHKTNAKLHWENVRKATHSTFFPPDALSILRCLC